MTVNVSQSPPLGEGRLAASAEDRFADFARSGDAGILDSLLTEHLDRAYCQARRLLGNSGDAEDAVQEAFVRLVRTAERYDGTVPFAAWLGRLVHAASLIALRSRGRRRKHEARAGIEDRCESAVRPDEDGTRQAETVRAIISELPERYRATIDLHYFAGLSQRDTAVALGVSENAVAKQLQRAREYLRGLLLKRGVTMSAVGISALLASTTAYAAPAAARLAADKIVGAVASGTSIPASTLSTGIAGHAFAHPIAAAICALAIAATATLTLIPAGAARFQANWDFSQAAPTDFEILAGEWSWDQAGERERVIGREATRLGPVNEAAGMVAIGEIDGLYVNVVAVRLPASLPSKPLAGTVKLHTRKLTGSDCRFFWMKQNNFAVDAAIWWTKTPMLFAAAGYSETVEVFVLPRYIVVMAKGNVRAVVEYVRDWPSNSMCFSATNLVIESIELHEAAPGEIPPELTDMPQLIERSKLVKEQQ
jgi:RNA polymerase sigma factor (sigma-70 family)